jgi:hypothetical protein
MANDKSTAAVIDRDVEVPMPRDFAMPRSCPRKVRAVGPQ